VTKVLLLEKKSPAAMREKLINFSLALWVFYFFFFLLCVCAVCVCALGNEPDAYGREHERSATLGNGPHMFHDHFALSATEKSMY
jgi:hypothetical protein